MRRILLGLVIGMLVMSACTSYPSPPAAAPNPLTGAPERVSLAGKALIPQATASRDFQPIAPAGGKPLGVALRVKTVDGGAVPSSVHADTVWVIGNGETWSARVEERPRAETGPDYVVGAGNGPKWAPGTQVDIAFVLIRLILGARGRFARLMADHMWFRLPVVDRIFTLAGAVDGDRDDARHLLDQGRLVLAYPGGVREIMSGRFGHYAAYPDPLSIGIIPLPLPLSIGCLSSAVQSHLLRGGATGPAGESGRGDVTA